MKKTTYIATLVAAATFALPLVAQAAPERPSFPMDGDTFLEHVEGRLDHAKERIERSDAPEDKKQKALERLEDRSSAFLKAASAAAADGTVTKEEARELRQKMGARKGKRGHGKKGRRAERASFPMEGDAFVAAAEKRVAARRAKLASRLDERGADAEKKAAALERYDARSAKVLAAARDAAADGTVTRDEVRAMRKAAPGKRGHAKGKAKGHAKGKPGS